MSGLDKVGGAAILEALNRGYAGEVRVVKVDHTHAKGTRDTRAEDVAYALSFYTGSLAHDLLKGPVLLRLKE